MGDGLFFDWLAREGMAVLSWWLLVLISGAVAWPLSFRLLGGLPDRGYALVRTLGMLVIGFVFWLGASLGLLTNSNGSVALAALVVLAAGLAVAWPQRAELADWMRDNWKYMLLVEVIFFGLFVAWVSYRALAPALTGTEKPMELAFLSAVRRSPTFPPNDPWMSGYAISYYYFGYVMAAVLANLSNVSSGMAFNLMIALLFALIGVGVFGVIYNLLRSRFLGHRRKGALEPTPRWTAILFGMLGILFVLFLGNLQTAVVEVPYQEGVASEGYLSFFDVEERDAPRSIGAEGLDQWNFWWWFRASRVIRDRDLSGQPAGIQPIDEFPAFSFVLADMHPHVLALPFAVLALGLALNLLLSGHEPTRAQIVLYGVSLGGLVFLNTWDGPIYMGVMVGAEALRRLMKNGTGRLTRGDILALLRLGVTLVGLTLVFYAPFFIGFRSQLGGILPNVIFTTRIHQFLLMFGPFVIFIGFLLALEVWRGQEEMNWTLARNIVLLAFLGLFIAGVALGLIAWIRPEVRGVVYSVLEAQGGFGAIFGDLLRVRFAGLPLLLMLGGMSAVIIARLFAQTAIEEDETPYSAATGFVLLLVGVGAVLTVLPEFVYLRDNFAVRINTMFKFYYQAWLVWAVASTYAAYTFLADVEWHTRPSFAWRGVFSGVLLILVTAGLLYPTLAVYSRAFVEAGRNGASSIAMTLDGGPTLATPDDYAVAMCMDAVIGDDPAVMVEAVGTAYHPEQGGRISALTGVPTVIAWENHERQWRGQTYNSAAGTRAADVERLYNDPNWPAVTEIIERYGIDYVFIGSAEHRTFDAFGIRKFMDNLTPVCQSGEAMAFRVNGN